MSKKNKSSNFTNEMVTKIIRIDFVSMDDALDFDQP